VSGAVAVVLVEVGVAVAVHGDAVARVDADLPQVTNVEFVSSHSVWSPERTDRGGWHTAFHITISRQL